MVRAVLPLIVTLLAASAAIGDDPPAAPAASDSTRSVRAARAGSVVVVDGVLSEPVWQQAEPVDWFKQSDPNEGAQPSQRTEVRVMYDDDAIYIGARMHDAAADSIVPRLTRRDVSIPCDRFSIYLDPFYDRRSGYYFMVNCAGTKYDGTVYNDGWEDSSWDGVWEGRSTIDKQGWSCEMRIPYSQLRFQKADEYKWGINFRRVIQRRNEEDFLVYRPKKGSGFVSLFPTLTGIQSVAPGRSIEVIPYVTSQAEYLRHETGNPFNDGSSYEPDGGVDVRMPLGSRLTLNATVNPDFGQVEVDPAVVNLSDIESFFQEKRTFFVEGATVFNTGNQGADDYWGFNWPEPTFFYSRRIGRAPQGGLPDVQFADVPRGVSILGAGKVTGKITPTVNFGTLHALTAKESADLSDAGSRFRSEVEPLTYYGVLRALKEFKDRRQGLGFMSTYTRRSFTDQRLRDELNSSSLLGVVDGWYFLDKQKMWVVSGYAGATNVAGNTTRMTALQQDSRHYFQRPDAGHVEVDPNATSLTGYAARFWLNKQKGSSFSNSAIGFLSPKFENNDLGFLSRADVVNAHVGYGYKWTETTKARKYQNLLGAVFGSWDFDGNNTWGGVWGGGTTEFINNYSWEYRAAYNPQTINNRRTRGGPLTLNMPGYELFNYFDTDGKSKQFYYLESYGYTQPEADSYNWYMFPGMEWKPVSNLTLNVGPGFERNHNTAYYIDTIDDASATNTYGRRYIFGTLDQSTLSANIRLNWAFTPNLSLQFYGQPLISTAKVRGLKELARGRSYDFVGPGSGTWTYDASTGLYDADGTPSSGDEYNPDFNFKSLRGNAVLRWEYQPGSTFYLVWTQERTDEEDLGTLNLGSSFRRMVNADADNIFLAKVSYYWNL